MDVLMLVSQCCILNRGLLYGSQSKDKIKLDVRGGGQWNSPDLSSMRNGKLHIWMGGCLLAVHLLL